MALNFKTLLTRTLTAAVFVAILLSAILWNYYSFSILFFVVAIWGLHEFFKISEGLGAKPFRWIGFVLAALIYLSIFIENNSINRSLLFLFVISIFFVFVNGLFSQRQKPLQDIAFTLFGVFYCSLPFVFLNLLSFSGAPDQDLSDRCYKPHIVLGIILLIWASDTYAYLVGSMIGKHKLYERISPGKTWEGTIGGGILTLASSYIVSGWFPEIGVIHWLVISGIVVVFGTLGDLFESLLKRQAGIKDSGKIMPGHGGILDRFDSLMFVSPFAYLYLNWVLG
jgi:phosphatidate cytidylyltransferase